MASSRVARGAPWLLPALALELRHVFCAPDGTVIYLGELAYRGDFIRLDMDLLS